MTSKVTIERKRYLDRLIAKQNNGLIKVITGLRRAGKSYLLFRLFKSYLLQNGVDGDHIFEMAFDSFENKKFCDPEVFYPFVKSKIKDEKTYYILLDEVQLLGEFEAVLNSLIRVPNVDVYVTGSNAKFLSKDVITEFRGRADEVPIFPLSFSEFMSVYSGAKEAAWDEFLLYGGLPLITSFTTSEQKVEFLKALFKETYIQDIISRNNIRNKSELEEILNITASAIGSLTNPQKLSDTFLSVKHKVISATTVQKYLDAFCDSFLIDKALRYDLKGKKYINTPLKFYFTDIGLRNAQLNFRQLEESHSMENAIFNELKIRGFNIDVGLVLSIEKNKNGNSVRKQQEVDFVCNKASKRYYIQSALSIPTKEKRIQEESSLLKINDAFKKILVTKDSAPPHYDESGVLILNIYDFMLNDAALDF